MASCRPAAVRPTTRLAAQRAACPLPRPPTGSVARGSLRTGKLQEGVKDKVGEGLGCLACMPAIPVQVPPLQTRRWHSTPLQGSLPAALRKTSPPALRPHTVCTGSLQYLVRNSRPASTCVLPSGAPFPLQIIYDLSIDNERLSRELLQLKQARLGGGSVKRGRFARSHSAAEHGASRHVGC